MPRDGQSMEPEGCSFTPVLSFTHATRVSMSHHCTALQCELLDERRSWEPAIIGPPYVHGMPLFFRTQCAIGLFFSGPIPVGCGPSDLALNMLDGLAVQHQLPDLCVWACDGSPPLYFCNQAGYVPSAYLSPLNDKPLPLAPQCRQHPMAIYKYLWTPINIYECL